MISAVSIILREAQATDYRTQTTVQLSEAPELLKVNEHGEVKSGPMSEMKESLKVENYARIISLTQGRTMN